MQYLKYSMRHGFIAASKLWIRKTQEFSTIDGYPLWPDEFQRLFIIIIIPLRGFTPVLADGLPLEIV